MVEKAQNELKALPPEEQERVNRNTEEFIQLFQDKFPDMILSDELQAAIYNLAVANAAERPQFVSDQIINATAEVHLLGLRDAAGGSESNPDLENELRVKLRELWRSMFSRDEISSENEGETGGENGL
jgi:hypothetical protein